MTNWQETIRVLNRLNQTVQDLFGSAWRDDSGWEWLGYLQTQMSEFVMEEKDKNIQSAYFYATVGTINFSILEKIQVELDKLNGYFSQQSTALESIRVNPESRERVTSINIDLDLQESVDESLLTRLVLVPAERHSVIIGELEEIARLYTEFMGTFLFIAPALLYYRPQQTFATFAEFQAACADAVANPDESANLWPALIRYLSQAFFSHDPDARENAYYYLIGNPIDEVMLSNSIYRIVYSILLFIAFQGFEVLSEVTSGLLMSGHAWLAIQFGVPIEIVIKEKLASAPLIDLYVYTSGLYGHALRESIQPLFYDKANQLTVGDFIQVFVDQKLADDMAPEVQNAYIEKQIKAHSWKAELNGHLSRLLSLYIHLRECDLIDYHGILAEDGLRKEPYDWKQVLDHDLSKEEVEDITEYLKLLHRPSKIKVDLILTFLTVNWGEEPYLSRVLVLNDIYTELYPEPFGPIVYFDEPSLEWRLRRDLPPPWNDIVWPTLSAKAV